MLKGATNSQELAAYSNTHTDARWQTQAAGRVLLGKQDKQETGASLKSSAFSNYLMFAFWKFARDNTGRKYSANAVAHFERLNVIPDP